MGKLFLKHKLLLSSILIIPSIAMLIQCSPGLQANSYKISDGCGKTKVVSEEELHDLVHANHNHNKLEEGQRIKCPGFFAVLDDEEEDETLQQSISYKMRLQAKENNCNIGGAPGPELPEVTKSKEELIKELVTKTNGTNIRSWVENLSDGSLWPTRYHLARSNTDVPNWIAEEFRKLANGRTDIKIRTVAHKNTPQHSVEVIIEGNGDNKDQFVVLGGHQDSIHGSDSRRDSNARAPGADDNASGVASLLEAFRVLMEADFKPDATVVFYTYAAEEIGLVGSQEIARTWANERKEVLGVMQIDMAMYSTRNSNKIQFISDYVNQDLTALAASLAEDYLGLEVSYMSCGYACSDHASWTENGFPSMMPVEDEFSASAKRIHTLNDVADNNMSGEYASNFSKLAVAFALSLALNE